MILRVRHALPLDCHILAVLPRPYFTRARNASLQPRRLNGVASGNRRCQGDCTTCIQTESRVRPSWRLLLLGHDVLCSGTDRGAITAELPVDNVLDQAINIALSKLPRPARTAGVLGTSEGPRKV